MGADTLVQRAQDAMRHAHAPYSKFRVGAALEAEDGTVYVGCNVENASYGGTICAERSAAVSAVAAGRKRFVRIAIASDAGEPVAPCGICRQFLAEFGMSLQVISAGATGRRMTWTLGELLPAAFTGSDIPGGTRA